MAGDQARPGGAPGRRPARGEGGPGQPHPTIAPSAPGSILALDSPALAILKQLPGRPAVDLSVASSRPAQRIIHLADWHLVPEDLLARDLRSRLGRPPSRKELVEHFRGHLLQVEGVQQEQLAILRHLIRHHGLTTVLQEGVTAEDYEDYRLRLDLLDGGEERLDIMDDQRWLTRAQGQHPLLHFAAARAQATALPAPAMSLAPSREFPALLGKHSLRSVLQVVANFKRV